MWNNVEPVRVERVVIRGRDRFFIRNRRGIRVEVQNVRGTWLEVRQY
jgi:hypothetical protein